MTYLCVMIAAAIVSYLIGYIASYLMFRMICREDLGKYSVTDRLFNLFLSLFSWVTFGILLMGYLIVHIDDTLREDKEAKW